MEKTILQLKNVLLITLLFAKISEIYSQTYWVNEAGNVGVDEALDISSDFNNNNYTIGYFSNDITFGGTTLSTTGLTDCYVTKSDNSGSFIWAIKCGGTGADKGLSIKTDSEGNSLICGYFTGSATFGDYTLVSDGFQDGFVAKINSAGTILWATSFGGSQNDIANAVNFDLSGNVLVTGQFVGSAEFGGITLISAINPFTLITTIDVFTVKLNSSGIVIWAEQGKGNYTDRGIDVACDNVGNVYITGQFSDTITFDFPHNNVANNSAFLVKYNSSGEEQWFSQIGGSVLNIVSGIAIDSEGNIFVTGDFEGQMMIFANTNLLVDDDYSTSIFIAKYNGERDILWATSSGSNSEVTSKNIVVDNLSNAYITGSFSCKFDAFSEEYGEATFNSMGKTDVYAAKFNSFGNFEAARNCGGLEEDNSYGITLNYNNNVVIAGSFKGSIIFASYPELNVIPGNTEILNGNNGFCGDLSYGSFKSIASAGSIDMFIGTPFKLSRLPFDYYLRNLGGSCNQDFVGVCVGDPFFNFCADTVKGCGSGNLGAISNTNPSPNYSYLWSNGFFSSEISANFEGMYWVTQTSQDGCFISSDTSYVEILPSPDPIFISDSYGININNPTPVEIILCAPDSVFLTASNTDPYEVTWSNNSVLGNVSEYITESGVYSCGYLNEDGCVVTNSVSVEIVSYAYPDPYIKINDLINDSISICDGNSITILVRDSLELTNLCDTLIGEITSYQITPFDYAFQSNCYLSFSPNESGFYTIDIEYTQSSGCQSVIYNLSKTIYVELLPSPDPVFVEMFGLDYLCFGDTVTFTATSSLGIYNWGGPDFITSEYDSVIYAYQPGYYFVSASITNEYGCSKYDSDNINLQAPNYPVLTTVPENAIICPSDSIKISCDVLGTYQWYGPEGLLNESADSIFVTTSGFYFCVVTNLDGCVVTSNTVELIQYTTPYLFVYPSTEICPNSSVTINVITTSNSNLTWQSPLSGTELTQLIEQPDNYTVTVDACGILTTLNVNIIESDVEAVISSEETILCQNDSIQLTANEGYIYQWLPSGETSSSIYINEIGSYQLFCTNTNNCFINDTIVITSTTIEMQPIISNNSPVCDSQQLNLTSTTFSEDLSYFWYGPNGFTSTLQNPILENVTELQEGEYSLVTTLGLCSSNSVVTNTIVDPAFSLSEITSNFPICIGKELFLYADFFDDASYLWTGPDGFTSIEQNPVLNFEAQDTGTYYVTVYSGVCYTTKETFIYGDDCNISSINVFTPNGDGINDYFSFNKENLLNLNVEVYNRWGQLIYYWDGVEGSWDGTILSNGKKAEAGVYYYIANLLPRNGYLQNVKGYLNLIY